MTIISIFTYLIVFNLERLVRNSHSFYTVYRSNIVDRMSADLGWEDRAKRFDAFEPDRRSTKPTEWYVLWASVILLFQHWQKVTWPGLLRVPRQALYVFWKNDDQRVAAGDR